MNSTSIPLLDWSDPRISDLLGKKTTIVRAPSPQKNGAAAKPVITKVANWQTCAEVKPRELLWLWPGKIPLGLLTMFAGDPSLGKSLMTIETMARGSRGTDFLDGARNELGVFETILLAGEDDPATIIVPRLMAAGADLAKIHRCDMVRLFSDDEALEEERLLTLESDLVVIREKLQANPSIKLVIVDPISNYLGSRDLNREQEVRSVLMPIIALAQEFSVAVVIVAHHSKQAGRMAQHKVIGAVGCVGAGRMGWSFVKSQDDEKVTQMLLMKHNLGDFPGINFTTETSEIAINGKPSKQARIKYLSTCATSIETVLAQSEDQEARKEKPAIAFIKKHLPKEGETPSNPLIALAAEEGISKKQLFSARQTLGIKPVKHRDGWYWEWTPPEDQDA